MSMVEKIVTAKTVDSAIALAAEEFGVPAEQLEVEILEEPKRGLFGGLKGEAKIRAVFVSEPTKGEVAAAYIERVTEKLDVKAEIAIEEVEGGAVLDLKGEGLGVLIGRRGETLDALQYLASLVCNKEGEDYYRITVDSNGYREKRKQTLEELAVKIAKTVARTGRTSALEPMNPYERRIIHSAVATVEGVASRSTGEDPNRKVIISSLNKKPRNSGGKGGRGKNKGKRPYKPRAKGDGFTTSFEKEYKRPTYEPSPYNEIEKDDSTELYGKIEI